VKSRLSDVVFHFFSLVLETTRMFYREPREAS